MRNRNTKTQKRLVVILVIVLLISVPLPVFAHSGRTDEDGGHYDSSTGEYHYHHGWPPHDHDGGECPYNFVDNVDRDRDNSSKSKDKISPPYNWKDDIELFVFLGIVAIICVILLIRACLHERKEGKLPTLDGFFMVLSCTSLFFLVTCVPVALFVDGMGWFVLMCVVVFLMSILCLHLIHRWEKKQQDKKLRAKAIIPDFKVYFSPNGTRYHSTDECTGLRSARSIQWATDTENTPLIYKKTPCSKCCYMQDGKAYAKPQPIAGDPIAMLPIQSSNLKRVGYRAGILFVTFHNGSTYRYDGVPESVYDELLQAPSIGKYFNTYIRDCYPAELTDPPYSCL